MKLTLIVSGISRAMLEQIIPEIRRRIFQENPFLYALDHYCKRNPERMPELRVRATPKNEVWRWN